MELNRHIFVGGVHINAEKICSVTAFGEDTFTTCSTNWFLLFFFNHFAVFCCYVAIRPKFCHTLLLVFLLCTNNKPNKFSAILKIHTWGCTIINRDNQQYCNNRVINKWCNMIIKTSKYHSFIVKPINCLSLIHRQRKGARGLKSPLILRVLHRIQFYIIENFSCWLISPSWIDYLPPLLQGRSDIRENKLIFNI